MKTKNQETPKIINFRFLFLLKINQNNKINNERYPYMNGISLIIGNTDRLKGRNIFPIVGINDGKL